MLQSCTKIFRGAASDLIFIKDNMLYDPCRSVGFNSHFYGTIMGRRIIIYQHPLNRQVPKTALALEKEIHPFRSVSLGQRS